ncbi:uncharacterized protein LOC128553182, partial [Mercenaria mercenaria]|uniref:uncharacterized protein LOC128553182 n=1 Tax=Mercenaria mercenaria TaxID=6596 RepID=UPI00234F197E
MAIDQLNELKDKQIEVQVSEDLQKEIRELKEHAMGEVAVKVKEAMKQTNIKQQELEEKLKRTEEELQLLRDLRSKSTESEESTHSTEPFEMELHIRVVGPTGETSTEGNQRICNSMKGDNTRLNINTEAHVHSTNQSVHHLFGYINTIKGCKIVDVLNTDVSVNIKIHCFTRKAIADFLKSINGNEFQRETSVLRECLERLEHINGHDVVASCSSESIDNTRKRLDKRGVTTDFTCGNHQGTQCTWYCSDHDTFFCSACKDSDH